MKIKEKMYNDVAVFSIIDEHIGQLESGELYEHIDNMIDNGIKKFVIDLSKVKWLSSSSLGVFIASRNIIVKKGGNLKLVGVTEKVQSLLTLNQLIQFFEITDTVKQAIASF